MYEQELTYTKLITLLKEHECLWDVNNVDFKNREAREEAYRIILVESGLPNITIPDVKKKVKLLRAQYVRQKKKLEQLKASGAKAIPTLYWYNHANNHCPFNSPGLSAERKAAIGNKTENFSISSVHYIDNKTENLSTNSVNYIDNKSENFSTSSVHYTDNKTENLSTSSVDCIDIKTEKFSPSSAVSSDVEDTEEHFMEYNEVTPKIEFADTHTSSSTMTSNDVAVKYFEDSTSESFGSIVKNVLNTLPPKANALCRKELYDILHKYQMEYVYDNS